MKTSPSSDAGFTLIEVMMALLVMTVGLLGLLQAVLIAAQHETQNVLREESYRIAEEQLNKLRVTKGAFNNTTTVNKQIRGGTWAFLVTKSKAPKAIGGSTRLSVTVNWNYKGYEAQHQVVSMGKGE